MQATTRAARQPSVDKTNSTHSASMRHSDETAAIAASAPDGAPVDLDLEAAEGDASLASYGDPSDAAYARHQAKRRRLCARYGRTWVLYSCGSEYGYFPATAHVGPHWPCMLLTYAIAIGPAFLVLLNDDFKTGFRIALVVSSVLTTLVFSLVACSDPGVVYETDQPMTYLATADHAGGRVICAQCQVRRPKTASHCSDCGVCVNKLDHHCPWTGKCIGVRTLWLFYMFIWCISVHVVILSVGCTITFLNS